jgi:HD-GYP domain-containing protein (c-di-GMP phosphodiesterase class II)
MLPDPEGKHLTIAKAVGIDRDLAATVRVPVGGAIAGQVFLTGQGVVVNTPEEAKWHGDHYDSQFFASVPLICRALGATEHVVGVLNVTERQGGRPFDPRDLEFADLLCNMAASVIDDFVSRQARDEARDSVVAALATLAEYRDTDTGKHLDRVTSYASIIAEELRKAEPFGAQIDDQFLQDLGWAMPLHDIGKVAVPDHILLKPGKLTPAETAIMRRHAEAGAETLRSVMTRAPGARFLRMAEQIAYHHHEWYDGSGYPRCLRGQDIPLAARIAALADVYDALTTIRPYREAISHHRAAQIIREGYGSQFDPAVVEAFCRREADFVKLATELGDPARPHEGSESIAQQTVQPIAAL